MLLSRYFYLNFIFICLTNMQYTCIHCPNCNVLTQVDAKSASEFLNECVEA